MARRTHNTSDSLPADVDRMRWSPSEDRKGRVVRPGDRNPDELPTEDRSLHPTVVQYALHEMMKRRTPATAAKNTAKSLGGHPNVFLGPVIPVIDPKLLEEALWEHLTDLVIKTINSFKPGAENIALGSVVDLYKQGPSVEKKLRGRVIKKLGRDPFPATNPSRRSARRSIQRRNPAPWLVPVAVAGTAIVLGSAAFLGVRHFVIRRLTPVRPPRLEPDPAPTVWWEHDLAEVMPAKADFPLGWDVDDIGFFDPAGVDGYRFAWRLLKLRAPSERCSPPCEWIVVATGEGHGREVAGFWGAPTRQEALELLQTKHEVVS